LPPAALALQAQRPLAHRWIRLVLNRLFLDDSPGGQVETGRQAYRLYAASG
jgi:hypothetical protein